MEKSSMLATSSHHAHANVNAEPTEPQTVEQLIVKYSTLFWHIPENKKFDLSEDVLVEYILNYGSYDACKDLLHVLGHSKVAQIFFSHLSIERRKQNYFPEIVRYFTQYFERHAL
jgi:hypothetical protein